MKMLAGLLIWAAVPASAGAFNPPEGCTTFMTVQSRQCRVSNHYKCVADASGDQWRADFDQQGPFFLSKINAEAEWIESYDLGELIVRQVLRPGATDPANFSELLSTGTDTFAFGLSRDNGEETDVSGFDRLTGRSFTIDGISLAETQFEFTEALPDGTVLRQSRGNEYISRDMRLFFSGPSEWNGGDGTFLPTDGSPVQFIFPGEPGFAATEPLFDCDPLLTNYSPIPKEHGHDDL